MNTEQALNEIGERLKRHRLNRNLSQKEVSERAGIGLASVARLEDGKGSTLANFIRVLTALDALNSLDAFLPMPSISPIQLAKLHGKERQKASKKS
jgi:transcriptional regulator with XRE-family HTH domain